MTDVEVVPGYELADMELAKRAHDVLHKHYPGHAWAIGLNEEKTGGVMYIQNPQLQDQFLGGTEFAYVLKLSRVYQDPDLKCVLMAGGEILERCNIARGHNKGDKIKKVDGVNHDKYPIILRGLYD